jgi:hypothetical protein
MGKLATFIGSGLKKSVEISFTDDQVFDKSILGKAIAPKATVIGWVFIGETEQRYVAGLEWRCIVRDIQGGQSEAPVTFLEAGTKTMHGAPIPFGEEIDLSNAVFMPYGVVNPYGY